MNTYANQNMEKEYELIPKYQQEFLCTQTNDEYNHYYQFYSQNVENTYEKLTNQNFWFEETEPTNEQRINKKLLFPSEDSELIQSEESSQGHVPQKSNKYTQQNQTLYSSPSGLFYYNPMIVYNQMMPQNALPYQNYQLWQENQKRLELQMLNGQQIQQIREQKSYQQVCSEILSDIISKKTATSKADVDNVYRNIKANQKNLAEKEKMITKIVATRQKQQALDKFNKQAPTLLFDFLKSQKDRPESLSKYQEMIEKVRNNKIPFQIQFDFHIIVCFDPEIAKFYRKIIQVIDSSLLLGQYIQRNKQLLIDYIKNLLDMADYHSLLQNFLK